MTPKTPTMALTIKGGSGKEELDGYLTELKYTEAVGEMDGLTASFNFKFTEMGDFAKDFEPGKTFELELKEGTASAGKREGDIIAVSYHRKGQRCTVTLIGVNYLHRLRSEHKTKVWKGKHKTIVSTIAGKAKPKLTAKVQGVDAESNFTFQQNETDAIFLLRLAREHNYYCRVVGKELHFGRRDLAYGTPVKVTWGTELQECRMTANLKDHLNEVQVYWGDYEKDIKQKVVKYPTKPKAIPKGGKLGMDLGNTAFGKKIAVLGGFESAFYTKQTQAKAKAKAELEAAAMDFIEGRAVCSGLPKAKCGAKFEIADAECWPFDGDFIITKVEHYRTATGSMGTDVTFKGNALPKP